MKIKQLNLSVENTQSFTIRRDSAPRHHNVWHYHEELELILVAKGKGRLFVGDNSLDFCENDIVLIGANMPHYWLFHNISLTEETEDSIDCVVIHFRSDFLGATFADIPEGRFFKDLLHKSGKALHTRLDENHPIIIAIKSLLDLQGITRLTRFIELLSNFHNTSPTTLASSNYHATNQHIDVNRMNKIMEYIRQHFTDDIALDELAKIAQMTKNSFSRYFKHKTGKTPMQLIFDLRITHACNLLSDPQYPLKEVYYEVGFNNPVSFHKTFKKIKGTTPRTFRKMLLQDQSL